MTDCIFCKIADGQIPAKIIFENEWVLAFHDITPQAPFHALVIPRKHIEAVRDLSEKDSYEIMPHVFEVIKAVTKELGFEEDGYRIVSNCGVDGGQTVNHMHFHILGGRKLQWPPG